MRVYIPANVNAGPIAIASGTLGTVQSVTNIAQVGGVAANSLVLDNMMQSCALNVRARVT